MISGLARTKDMSSVVIVLSGAHEALSQPFFVAEFFTNSPGQYVKLQATISGLTRLVDGMYDQWDERWVSLTTCWAASSPRGHSSKRGCFKLRQIAEIAKMDKNGPKVLSKVRPKSGPKRVQNPPRRRKSPVKQANCKTREGQKRVKNGPQKRHQKSHPRNRPKNDEKPQ